MKNSKTIACDRCGARFDHIPEKCPECGEIIYDRMDPHMRERIQAKMKKRLFARFARPVFICVAVAVLLIIVCYVIIPLFISDTSETDTFYTLAAVWSAQNKFMSQFNVCGTFGDLYNAGFLREEAFNVGNGSAYKNGYTFTITLISSKQWEIVGVPDASNARWIMLQVPDCIGFSEDNGKTWEWLDSTDWENMLKKAWQK